MHEVWGTIRHQTNDLVADHLGVHGLSDVLLDHALVIGLLHVEVLTLSHQWLWKSRGHQLLVLKQHVE